MNQTSVYQKVNYVPIGYVVAVELVLAAESLNSVVAISRL